MIVRLTDSRRTLASQALPGNRFLNFRTQAGFVRFSASNTNTNNQSRNNVSKSFVGTMNSQNKSTNSVASGIFNWGLKAIGWGIANLVRKPIGIVVDKVIEYATNPKNLVKLASHAINSAASAFNLPPVIDTTVMDSTPIHGDVPNKGLSDAVKGIVKGTIGVGIGNFLKKTLDKLGLKEKTIALIEKIPFARRAKAEITQHLHDHQNAIIDIVDIPPEKMSKARKMRAANLTQAKLLQRSLHTLKREYPEEFKKPGVVRYLGLIDKWVDVLKGMEPYDEMKKVPDDIKTIMANNLIDMIKDRNEKIKKAGYLIGKEVGLSVQQLNKALQVKD